MCIYVIYQSITVIWHTKELQDTDLQIYKTQGMWHAGNDAWALEKRCL